jgi:DNA-directed RNA polymerase subunit RPC12/RpoP
MAKKTIKANRQVVEDYLTLFVNGRAYTMQSVRPHPESGRHHYFRPSKKGTDIPMMLTDDTILQHLEGEITVGLYAINPSTQRCKWVAIEPDYKNSLEHLLKLRYHLTQDGVQPTLEMSKRGGHFWIFLATPLLAKECRIYIHDLASWLGVPVKGSGLADGIEVFPKHDAIGPGDSGNPIRGPLGVHRGADRRFWFYGADYTLEAQIEYLNGLRKVTEEELRTFMTGKELKVLIPKRFRAAVQAITKAVNCTGCSHNHFVKVRQEEEGPRQSGQLQLSEARKTRQQPMWLEREKSVCRTD